MARIVARDKGVGMTLFDGGCAVVIIIALVWAAMVEWRARDNAEVTLVRCGGDEPVPDVDCGKMVPSWFVGKLKDENGAQCDACRLGLRYPHSGETEKQYRPYRKAEEKRRRNQDAMAQRALSGLHVPPRPPTRPIPLPPPQPLGLDVASERLIAALAERGISVKKVAFRENPPTWGIERYWPENPSVSRIDEVVVKAGADPFDYDTLMDVVAHVVSMDDKVSVGPMMAN